MRAFTGVTVDSSELLDELQRMQERLDLGFRPVEREKMHVTLQFFEDASKQEISEIEEAMESVETGDFNTDVRGLGAFPSEDYIRVVWAGVNGRKLQRVYRKASEHGVEPSSENSFHPHVSLLRVENVSPKRKSKLQKAISDHSDHFFGRLKVSSVKLFESEFTGSGTSYSEIGRVEL